MKILFTDSHFLIENNNTTSLKTELFNRNLAFFLFYTNRNDMEKHLSLYFFFSSMKRSTRQTSVLLKNIFSLHKP